MTPRFFPGLLLAACAAGTFLSSCERFSKADDPQTLLRRYLGAETIEDRVDFIRKPEGAAPLMRKHYGGENPGPVRFEEIRALTPTAHLKNGDYAKFSVVLRRWRNAVGRDVVESRILYLERSGGGWKVDWEASEGFNPVSARAFNLARPTAAIAWRVTASLSDRYEGEFKNRNATHLSVALESPRIGEGEAFPPAYVSKDSPDGNRMFAILQDFRPHRLTLALRFPPGGKGDAVVIDQLLAEDWIYDGPRELEPRSADPAPATPEEVLEEFMNAETAEARARFVFRPSDATFGGSRCRGKHERVDATLAGKPEDFSDNAVGFVGARFLHEEDCPPLAARGPVLFVFRRDGKEWKLDVETTLGRNPMTVEVFRAVRPAEAIRWRVLAKLDATYLAEFAKAQPTHFSVKLSAVEGEGFAPLPAAYVPKRSERGTALFDLLKDGRERPVLVSVRYPPRSRGDVVLIERLIAPDWLLPETR